MEVVKLEIPCRNSLAFHRCLRELEGDKDSKSPRTLCHPGIVAESSEAPKEAEEIIPCE